MPTLRCPSTYAFIVDDVFAPQIEETWVSMTEEQLDWSCKVRAL